MSLPIPKASAATVQRIHARYQQEVVESLNVCPFARRSRDQGRVHRPLFVAGDDSAMAVEVAQHLHALVDEHRDAEIVLHTFLVPRGHPWRAVAAFDAWLKKLREAWDAIDDKPPWYLVSFHPQPRPIEGTKLTPDTLVSLLRRSPDPVIQCVNALTLDEVRRQAQATAHARMIAEARELNPDLVPLLERTIAPDPELSADIARKNFAALAADEGRAALEKTLQSIADDRARAYADDDFLADMV